VAGIPFQIDDAPIEIECIDMAMPQKQRKRGDPGFDAPGGEKGVFLCPLRVGYGQLLGHELDPQRGEIELEVAADLDRAIA
jgi:hypothetical protein